MPLLAAVPVPALTTRVREIAVLAAAGVPRLEIGERLFVSIRTVDRHVEDGYRRLGVQSRDELPGALADLARIEGEVTPAATEPAAAWPFVGREAELARMRAALGAPEVAGIALLGPSGMGKSRLARRFAEEVAGHGWPVQQVNGDAPALEVSDAAARALAGRGRGVLVIDDAQLLDGEGAAALERVLAAGEPFVVLTARRDDQRGLQPAGAWTRRELVTITVGRLEPDDVANLLARALDGPVLRAAADALTTASEGNPLWLRELVHAAIVEGRLRDHDGAWELADTRGANPRLADLVESRLAPLDVETRRDLARLAAAGPLPHALAAELVDWAVLERLERSGLLERDDAGALRLAHSIYADELRARLPAGARRAWFARLVEAVDGRERSRGRDHPGAAVAARGRPPDPGRVRGRGRRACARAQRHRRRRPARPLRARSRCGPVGLSRARARRRGARGDPVAAEAAYEAAGGAADPVARARAALGGAELLTWSTSDIDRAQALLEAGLAAQPSDPWPEVLRSGSELLPALAGRAFECDPDADVETPVAEVAVRRSLGRAAALLTSGPSDRAVDESERARQLATRAGTPLLSALLVEVRAIAIMADGRMDDADEVVHRARAVALAAGDRTARSGCDLAAARLALVRGRPQTAITRFRDARADPLLHRDGRRWRAAQAGLAHARAMAGDAAGAAAELSVLGEPAPDQVEHLWAVAWAHLAAHDREHAVAQLRSIGELAAAFGFALGAAAMFLDALTAGGGRTVAEQVVALQDRVSGAVPDAIVAYGAAVAASDSTAILAAGSALAGLGHELSGAEAAARAAVLATDQGLTAVAARAAKLSRRLRTACEGALELTPLPAADAPRLSPRQLQIAKLAATGTSAAEIAARLGLSVRTVENHLQAAYERLGVNRRGDLAAALRAS